MKWLSVTFIVVFGVALYAVNAFEASLPLVQFVRVDSSLTDPVHTIVPSDSTTLAGTGANGAVLVDIGVPSEYRRMPAY